MKRAICPRQVLLIAQVSFLLFLVSSCSQQEPETLGIGTGAPGGSYYMSGLAISNIVNGIQGKHDFRLRQLPSTGSVSNINAIIAGDIQFGIAQSDRQYQAVNGLAEWKEKGPLKDLRSVLSLYTESVTLVATYSSDIRTIHDLKGKRVDIGPRGSGTRQNAIDILRAAEINPGREMSVHEEKLDARIRELMHGFLDAFFHTIGHPSQDIKSATFSVAGIRFIPPVNFEKILSEHPYYSRSFIPVAFYPLASNKEDVETIGVKATLVTSSRVSDDIVYAVTKAVFDNLESLGDYDHVLKYFVSTVRKEDMLDGLTAPIHPGALKFYQEIGLQVP